MGVTIPRYRIGEAFHRAKDLKFGRTLHAQQLRGAWRSWEKMFENRDNKFEICVYLVICINVYLCVLLNDVWAHPCIYYIIVLLYIMCMYYFVHKYTDVCVCVCVHMHLYLLMWHGTAVCWSPSWGAVRICFQNPFRSFILLLTFCWRSCLSGSRLV